MEVVVRLVVVATKTAAFVNVAVARVETLWLVTARPTYTVAAIEMV